MSRRNTKVFSFKRRRQGRTNYTRRLKLLVSGKRRAVIRLSNSNVYIQMVEFTPVGDRVILSCNAESLAKLGWKYSSVSIPASYLTGLLMGKNAIKKQISESIVDIGLKRVSKANRIFAAIKGMVDAGMNINVNNEMLPDNSRLSGKHIADYAAKIKNTPSFQKVFSGYIKAGLSPEGITKNFEEVKNKILGK